MLRNWVHHDYNADRYPLPNDPAWNDTSDWYGLPGGINDIYHHFLHGCWLDPGMRLLKHAMWASHLNDQAARRTHLRRAALSVVAGIFFVASTTAIQVRLAVAARAVGLAAFGGSVDGGDWSSPESVHRWTWLRARSWSADWFGAVRDDGVNRSLMWSARDLAFARFGGAPSTETLSPLLARWLELDLLAERPSAAGIERLRVGWPVRCVQATYVWGNRAEMDRVIRGEVVHGFDVSTSDSETLAALAGVSSMQPPVSVLPSTVVWGALVLNVGFWTSIAYFVISVPRIVAFARGVRWSRTGRCAQCGYSLSGTVGKPCPECGTRAKRPMPSAM